jgi:hypothetical protein
VQGWPLLPVPLVFGGCVAHDREMFGFTIAELFALPPPSKLTIDVISGSACVMFCIIVGC